MPRDFWLFMKQIWLQKCQSPHDFTKICNYESTNFSESWVCLVIHKKLQHLIYLNYPQKFFRRVGWQNEMVEKFRQIIGNSAKHCLAFSAGAWPQTILPRISQSTLVQAALRETYCVTKTSNSTWRQRYRLLSCPYIIWSAHCIFSPIDSFH